MEDLHVEIPKKFRKSLEKRFDLRRVEYEFYGNEKIYYIRGKCELCLEYFSKYDKCASCLFRKFESREMAGCIRWIEKIIGKCYFTVSHTDVDWWEKCDNEAREQIKKLVEEAKKLITWV